MQRSLTRFLLVTAAIGFLVVFLIYWHQKHKQHEHYQSYREQTALFNEHGFIVGWSDDHTHITHLFTGEKAVTDSDLSLLQLAPRLRMLGINYSQITDVGVGKLANCSMLEAIDLSFNRITDKSVPVLIGLPKLKTLWLLETYVTEQGISTLKKAKPGLKIEYFHSKIPFDVDEEKESGAYKRESASCQIWNDAISNVSS